MPAGPELPPQIEDLYERLKLPDRMLGGTYANVVMIRHMAEEFSFDFIANFYPRPVVVARIFFPAGRIPAFLDAMSNSLHIFRKKRAAEASPAARQLHAIARSWRLTSLSRCPTKLEWDGVRRGLSKATLDFRATQPHSSSQTSTASHWLRGTLS